METSTKEQVKSRMITNAASLWGIPANDIENSFDPLVALLIGACASEIEKLNNETKSSQARIVESIVNLIAPESSKGPNLAYGILYAEPLENIVSINPEYLFSYRREQLRNKTSLKYKDIYFSPVREFNLVNAKIGAIVTRNVFIDPNSEEEIDMNKQLVDKTLNTSTLYIGISSDLKEIPMKDLSFFFELKGVCEENLFYHHLKNARWSVNNKNIPFVNGLAIADNNRFSRIDAIFENVSDKTNIICEKVLHHYERNYITLCGAGDEGLGESSFQELDDCLKSNDIEPSGNLRWIKVEFPTIIDHTILEHIRCSLNAFPILNRQLKSFSYSLKDYINILPITCEDHFFDIKSIVNTEGRAYRARNKDISELGEGTFILRSSDISKFNSQKAREYIVHLIDLLKDESASFSFLNNDFLRKNLDQLNQVIARLEQKVDEASSDETLTTYVALKPFEIGEHLLVEYWTTNGSEANHITQGAPLALRKGFGINQGSCRLITTTMGGRDELSSQNLIGSARRSLTGNRIVSKEDIKALCFEIYGDMLEDVEIRRGYQKGIALKKGLVRCVEILLIPSSRDNVKKEEWFTLGTSLKYYLEKNSMSVLPYSIKLSGLDGAIWRPN
ncbi:type VI secretion system baseplate subunit TssF [Pareuzebyella sediminis]|uniref:type VI secretion system baseplate subunit TssF n=1 Tax=Pareuzebyella sediminis TaxID=2607998 RepID=UPI0011EC9FBA|nr:type VI secretion system baseplate subunit TssF [Pareuzebyella sediminis]